MSRVPSFLILRRENNTERVVGSAKEKTAKARREYKREIDGAVYTVIVEESETAKETVTEKIQKAIDRECDSFILAEKRAKKQMYTKPLNGC